jgi:hypothetical protein
MEKKRDVRPVESEVTASHVVHGRRCTRIEQTNSLSSICDGCKDLKNLDAMEEQIATIMEKKRDMCPVESKVTGSHVHGRRCTGIEQTNSLSSICDGCKDSTNLEAMEEQIATIMEKKRDVHPVKSEVTASHVHGRRCTGIEQTNILSSICDGCKDKTTKRGFQHLYRSKTTTTSLRVHAAFIESMKTMTSGAPSCHGRRRYYKKRKKIEALQVVSCSDTHSLERTLLQSTNVFFSGTTIPTLQTSIANSLNLSAVTDLKVVDSKDGARIELSNGDTVFTLIPRWEAICGLTNVNNTLAALYALEKGKKSAETRGKKRIPVAEDNRKYITIGLKPARGRAGILESWPTNLSNDEWNTITKLMTNCKEGAKSYIFSHAL